MATGLTELLGFLSDSTAARVTATARRVAAIRIGTRQHLCATLWSPDVAVACGRLLPEQDSYLLLLDSGHAVGRIVWRDEASGLAGMQLDTAHPLPTPLPTPTPTPPGPGETEPGTLLISIGVDAAGTPVAGLAVLRGPLDGQPTARFPSIDRETGSGDLGGPLIAPSGALVGIVTRGCGRDGKAGPARVIAHAEIARLVARTPPSKAPKATAGPVDPPNETQKLAVQARSRGWLGLGLQPIVVARGLRDLAGQISGRMVIDIVPNGPADQAGLLSGDVVLTIDEHSLVGSGAMRDFLAQDRIGDTSEMVLLRAGELIRLNITVSARPPH